MNQSMNNQSVQRKMSGLSDVNGDNVNPTHLLNEEERKNPAESRGNGPLKFPSVVQPKT